MLRYLPDATKCRPGAVDSRCVAAAKPKWRPYLSPMRHQLNIDLIFPMKDEVSAALMCLKAELLFEANVIDIDEMSAVIQRAAAILDRLAQKAA
ncbi:MAG TPA: hypothetical protein VH678_18660 [Xanthobacteraceae bacterium]|jgi:hypothetical protein